MDYGGPHCNYSPLTFEGEEVEDSESEASESDESDFELFTSFNWNACNKKDWSTHSESDEAFSALAVNSFHC